MIPAEQDILIRDMARQFAQERLKPFAADWDREQHFPLEVIRRAAEQGYLALYIGEDDGGLGLSRQIEQSILGAQRGRTPGQVGP